MKVMKRNQVVILVIALMLVTAGYLNFTETAKQNNVIPTSGNNVETMGDATFVSSNALLSNNEVADTIANIAENTSSISEIIDTNVTIEEGVEEYFANSKLERDTMYSQMIESYQKMLDSTAVSAEQKAIAQNEITKINETKNAVMITENLIKTKGFEDVVILVNGTSINVILSDDELKAEEVAQVQNIVSREMKAEIENIHISNK